MSATVPPDTTEPPGPALLRQRVNESWLLRLRWVAVVGQMATVATAAWLFRVPLPLGPLCGIIAATAISNIAFAVWLRAQERRGEADLATSRDETVLVAVMTLDLISLTALLYYTGGPTNPYTIFYFVNLALAAVILPARWGWGLTSLAAICLLGLYEWYRPLPALNRPLVWGDGAPAVTLGQFGYLVAFVGCAGVISYFITRVTRELQERERELRVAEQRRARSERLEALATLAAGAGHELASPLSTIAVIAKDLARHLEGTPVPASVIEDVQLIRGELDHCREILNNLSTGAGQATGEEMHSVAVRDLVEDVVGAIRRRDRVDVSFGPGAAEHKLVVPRLGLGQAIRGIVRNALDASPPDERVALNVSLDSNNWCVFTVIDRGEGMTPEALARAGEPFFTTKQPGKGMGLGIFLTRNVVERLGGGFMLDSNPARGTRAEIRLPS